MIFEGFLSASQRPQLYSRGNFDKCPSFIRTANAPAHTDLLQDKIAASVTINIRLKSHSIYVSSVKKAPLLNF